MIKPNFFLVGASKAGTTSLAQYLGRHPSIFVSEPKEPDFFNRFDDVKEIDHSKLREYLHLYEAVKNESVLGEASVSYLSSVRAAKHIYDFNPESKILISLRNPVQRVLSLYEMYVRHGLEQSFDHVVKTDPWLARQCLYYEAVKRFFDVFPRDQLLCVDFGRLTSEWDSVINDIYVFLSVDCMVVESSYIRNVGGVPKMPLLRVLTNRRLVSLGKQAIPKRFHGVADRIMKKVAFKKERLSEQDTAYLRDFFSDDVAKLDELLQTNYSTRWLELGS